MPKDCVLGVCNETLRNPDLRGTLMTINPNITYQLPDDVISEYSKQEIRKTNAHNPTDQARSIFIEVRKVQIHNIASNNQIIKNGFELNKYIFFNWVSKTNGLPNLALSLDILHRAVEEFNVMLWMGPGISPVSTSQPAMPSYTVLTQVSLYFTVNPMCCISFQQFVLVILFACLFLYSITKKLLQRLL